ncbi:MAG: hypothetical protein QOJ94_3342, partial [Sphingomonadales bacterium]|nr:hypothetical protein [Sphingomonadales bacterium]
NGRRQEGPKVTGKSLPLLLALAVAALPGTAGAQDGPDALVDASRQVDSGLALANRQVAANDLLGALGTLERVQFAHPEAVPPRLAYISLLCRLDDREGAEVELGLLAGQPVADSDWAGVVSACGPMARPAAPRKGRR